MRYDPYRGVYRTASLVYHYPQVPAPELKLVSHTSIACSPQVPLHSVNKARESATILSCFNERPLRHNMARVRLLESLGIYPWVA